MKKKIHIGILREDKVPLDRRVPFTPKQLQKIKEKYTHLDVCVQQSNVRAIKDAEYAKADIAVVEDVSHCDVLMGVKEVPIYNLIADKTYLFFSHTTKMQPYNRKLLQTILKKNIRLIDYEMLKNNTGNRILGFGRYAGIVGAYNGLLTYGKRYNAYALTPANLLHDVNELYHALGKIAFPPINIVLLGGGRVARGAMETLAKANITKIDPAQFLNESHSEPTYVQLRCEDYHAHKSGNPFISKDFFAQPQNYVSTFLPYTHKADMLIAGAYWNPLAPVLFTRADMLSAKFSIKTIADITCDIEGSIPSTKKASTIDDPIYDYDPHSDTIQPFASSPQHVSVMAVDNLPCELPRDASQDFGEELINNVLDNLFDHDEGNIIQKATIADGGSLTKDFHYLRNYASG